MVLMFYNKSLIIVLFVIFVVFSLLAFSFSAKASSFQQIVDYVDYATYSVSDTAGIWNVSAHFPTEWATTTLEVMPIGNFSVFEGNSISFNIPVDSNDSFNGQLNFVMFPLGGYVDPISPGYVIPDVRLLDPSMIPKDSYLEFSFDISISGMTKSGYVHPPDVALYFISAADSTRPDIEWKEIVFCDDWLTNSYWDMDTLRWSIEGRFRLSDYADFQNNPFTLAFKIPDFNLYDYYGGGSLRFDFNYKSFGLSFPVSDAIKIANDTTRGDKLLGNIEKALADQGQQLDDFINGDIPSSDPNGSGTVDDLDQAESALIDDLSIYLDSGYSYFEGARNVLSGVGEGFQALRLIAAPVFNLPFANDWVTVSVSLGLVGSFIGLVSLAQSAGHRQESKDRAASKKSRSKGG